MYSSNHSISTKATAENSSVATSVIAPCDSRNQRPFINKKLFLAISSLTTEEKLYFMLEEYRIRQVYIPKDYDTNASRGYAFLTFYRHEDAIAAMNDLDGTQLDGIILHPSWAAPRKEKIKESNKRNGSRKKKNK